MSFLSFVTKDNFFQSYDKFAELIFSFRHDFPNKEDIGSIFIEIEDTETLSAYQDEILVEFSDRLYGCGPIDRRISW